ncbi:MAG: alpha/beta hydrolase [Saprospiraceae bacterium]|nr:alpha/beta hydrolase [Saprospiraceae bacterium]
MSRLLFSVALLPIFSLCSAQVTGDWFGTLQVQGVQLRLVLHISDSDEGLVTTLDSPDQAAFGIAVAKTTFSDSKLSLDLVNLGAQFEGELKQDSLAGFWLQAGRQFPLQFGRKAKKVSKLKRPQEPSPPFPYQEEEVRFENIGADLYLSGTLTLPTGSNKPPVAILISGSGPQDRDESIAGHKPFLVLADHLTRQGLAVLRYDDRGTAQSTGNHATATTADFATDVESAIQYLRTRKDIDIHKIGLIGHSEGGIIAPMVAARSNEVAFMVLLASTGVSGKELSLQQAQSLRTFEVPDEDAFMAFNERAIDIAASQEDLKVIREKLSKHYNSVRPAMSAMMPEGTDLDAFIRQQVLQMTTPWSRFFYNYNPAEELAKISACPVLSLNGTKDLQVLADVNQGAIKLALKKAGNKDVTIKKVENLNHLFQECETGTMSEYGQIEQTFAPQALRMISDWIQSKTQ